MSSPIRIKILRKAAKNATLIQQPVEGVIRREKKQLTLNLGHNDPSVKLPAIKMKSPQGRSNLILSKIFSPSNSSLCSSSKQINTSNQMTRSTNCAQTSISPVRFQSKGNQFDTVEEGYGAGDHGGVFVLRGNQQCGLSRVGGCKIESSGKYLLNAKSETKIESKFNDATIVNLRGLGNASSSKLISVQKPASGRSSRRGLHQKIASESQKTIQEELMKSITESGMKKEFRQTKQKKWSRFKVQESFSESEYGDECEVNVVWGNSGIDDGAMAGKALIQQFMELYKYRYENYPNERQFGEAEYRNSGEITSERLVKVAMRIAKMNKKSQAKYLKGPQLVFEENCTETTNRGTCNMERRCASRGSQLKSVSRVQK